MLHSLALHSFCVRLLAVYSVCTPCKHQISSNCTGSPMTSLLNLTNFYGSSPFAEVWTVCQMQTHLLCGDANRWYSGAFYLNECSSKHIPIFALHRNVHLCMLNEYTCIQGFYKGTSFRKNGAQFISVGHQASHLPVGQYSGVKGGRMTY